MNKLSPETKLFIMDLLFKLAQLDKCVLALI